MIKTLIHSQGGADQCLISPDVCLRVSDVDTIERIEILNQLRSGTFDVLVGVNLLREGLDLPEVSLVIILDADKEGFLRSRKSLIQTIGRAARNINGKAIMYADKITKSMQETIDLTKKRRAKQELYNLQNKITPKQIIKNVKDTFEKEKITENKSKIKIYLQAMISELSNPNTPCRVRLTKLLIDYTLGYFSPT